MCWLNQTMISWNLSPHQAKSSSNEGNIVQKFKVLVAQALVSIGDWGLNYVVFLWRGKQNVKSKVLTYNPTNESGLLDLEELWRKSYESHTSIRII